MNDNTLKHVITDGSDGNFHDTETGFFEQDSYRLTKLNKATKAALDRYQSHETAHGTTAEIHRIINRVIKSFIKNEQKISVWSKGYEKDAYLINRAMKYRLRTSAPKVFKGLSRSDDASLARAAAVGDVFSFQEFVSTSYIRRVSQDFAETGVLLEIVSPLGIPVSSNRRESEFLLPAQTKFQVIEINEEIWYSDITIPENFLVVKVRQII